MHGDANQLFLPDSIDKKKKLRLNQNVAIANN